MNMRRLSTLVYSIYALTNADNGYFFAAIVIKTKYNCINMRFH